MVDFFIQGGGFMWPILIALLFGLAIIGERAYSLINSSSNTDQFFDDVKTIYDDSGKEQAIEFCENTPGPVASIFYAGLSKMEKTKEEIEKAVQNAGGLEMAFLEKNMIWINSVITIAPMLGFTGTVVGMIKAFEDIKMANDISPAVVAGGISQALLTTAFGLIVAMIMQVAQNFFVSMIDKLILDMEEQSIKIVEYLHSSKK
jgi:biopolymer transport protein ExbB